jgi:hypothetical protein
MKYIKTYENSKNLDLDNLSGIRVICPFEYLDDMINFLKVHNYKMNKGYYQVNVIKDTLTPTKIWFLGNKECYYTKSINYEDNDTRHCKTIPYQDILDIERDPEVILENSKKPYQIGDKLLCIEDYATRLSTGEKITIYYTEGKMYQITDADEGNSYLVIDDFKITHYLSPVVLKKYFQLNNEEDPEVTLESNHELNKRNLLNVQVYVPDYRKPEMIEFLKKYKYKPWTDVSIDDFFNDYIEDELKNERSKDIIIYFEKQKKIEWNPTRAEIEHQHTDYKKVDLDDLLDLEKDPEITLEKEIYNDVSNLSYVQVYVSEERIPEMVDFLEKHNYENDSDEEVRDFIYDRQLDSFDSRDIIIYFEPDKVINWNPGNTNSRYSEYADISLDELLNYEEDPELTLESYIKNDLNFIQVYVPAERIPEMIDFLEKNNYESSSGDETVRDMFFGRNEFLSTDIIIYFEPNKKLTWISSKFEDDYPDYIKLTVDELLNYEEDPEVIFEDDNLSFSRFNAKYDYKNGDMILCKKDLRMSDDNVREFTKGKSYIVNDKYNYGLILFNNHHTIHHMPYKLLEEHFEPMEEDPEITLERKKLSSLKYKVGDTFQCIEDYLMTEDSDEPPYEIGFSKGSIYKIKDIWLENDGEIEYEFKSNLYDSHTLTEKDIDEHFIPVEPDPEITLESKNIIYNNKNNKMKYIKLFEEQENASLSGKEGFLQFLKLVDKNDNMFSRSNFLAIDDFSYFFVSDRIKKVIELLDELEMKRSLQSAYQVLSQIKDDNLSFYFGVKKYTLEYGFYSNTSFKTHKVGEFSSTNNFLKKLDNKCLLVIKKHLNKSNLKLLNTLFKIKGDFEKIFGDVKGEIKVLDELRIRNRFKSELFNKEDLEQIKFLNTLDAFKEKFSWGKLVDSYVDISDEYISLYYKVKEKIIKLYDQDEIPS